MATEYGCARRDILEDWPILSKEEVRDDVRRFRRFHIPALRANTSGSTGRPMQLYRGVWNIAAEQAFLDGLVNPYGPPFGSARVAIIRGDLPIARQGEDPLPLEKVGRRKLVINSSMISGRTYRRILDELREFGPHILWIYPTGGDALASFALGGGETIPMPIVLSSSEMLTTEARARLVDAFRGAVIDYYGQAERVCLAVSYTADSAMFDPAYGKIELIVEPDADALPGYKVARIIATGYWNDAMPLVRYDTEDKILVPSEYGECELDEVCLGVRPFVRVVGRPSEYLLTPDGAKVQALNNIPRDVPGIRQAQFVQQSDLSVDIYVVPLPSFDEEGREMLLRSARTRIPASLGLRVAVVDRLETLPGGKTPFVIRRGR